MFTKLFIIGLIVASTVYCAVKYVNEGQVRIGTEGTNLHVTRHPTHGLCIDYWINNSGSNIPGFGGSYDQD
jgi:hypothetical protein